MKEFQSRIVAAWIVALPLAYAVLESARHQAVRLTTNAQTELADELRRSQHASFVSFFIAIFISLVVLIVATDALAKFIRQVMADYHGTRAPRGKLFP